MKFFNIINESKSFILLLLFTFTLAITSQSFASGVDSDVAIPETNLHEQCKVKTDLTTLNAANKEKCVSWCKIETNWVAKCAKIGVEKPGTLDTAGEAGEAGAENILLKTRMIKALKGLDDIATGLKVPDIYNDIYSFKIKLDKSLRPTLFEHMKPKEPATDADAIDKTLVSDVMKEIILDGLGYSDTNDDKLEKFFIDFRNKWLKFEAKGSVNLNTVAFEPSTFKALATASNHQNGPMHQIYNMLEEDKKVFSAAKYNNVIDNASEVATELKNLRDAIVTFLKDQLIVTGADKWPTEMDLEFSIKIGKLNSSLETFLDGLGSDFNIHTRADFEKITNYFIRPDYFTTTNVTEDQAKVMASYGFLVLTSNFLNPNLNPDKINEPANEFTNPEKNTLEYKIYATRLKAYEAIIKSKIKNIAYDSLVSEEGSLVHHITEKVRDATPNGFGIRAARTFVTAYTALPHINFGDNKTISRITMVNDKLVILIHGTGLDNSLIEFFTTDSGTTLPGFITTASIQLSFVNHNDLIHGNHSFTMPDSPLEVDDNTFASANILTNNTVNLNLPARTAIHTVNHVDAKCVKIRFNGVHGINYMRENPTRDIIGLPYENFMNGLRLFNRYFITDNTFGTDAKTAFENLTALHPSLGQLYAFNQFTSQLDIIDNDTKVIPANAVFELESIARFVVNNRQVPIGNILFSTNVIDVTNVSPLGLLITNRLITND